MTTPNDSRVRLCRDEDCPECGWPETYAEVDFTKPAPGADVIGCTKCGWRSDQDDPENGRSS